MRKYLFQLVGIILFISQINAQNNTFRVPVQDFNHETISNSLLSLPNNDLLYFWQQKYSANIYISRSTDAGINWSTPNILVDDAEFENYFNSQDVLIDDSSNIFFCYKKPLNYYKKSTDLGITWSEEKLIYAGPSILQGGNTRFISIGEFPNNRKAWVYSWNFQGLIKGVYFSFLDSTASHRILIDSSGFWGHICSVDPLKTYVVYADSNGTKTDLYYRYSSDNGISWSSQHPLYINPNSKNRPRLIKNTNGDLIVFYEELIPTFFNGFKQKEIFYIKSTNGGLTWQSPIRFTNYPGPDDYYAVSLFNSQPIISFLSTRHFNLENQLRQSYLLLTPEQQSPPYLVFGTELNDTVNINSNKTIRAYVDGVNSIQNVKLFSNRLEGLDSLVMYDDGLNDDSLAGDKIYGVVVNGFDFGSTDFFIQISDDQALASTFYLGNLIVPIGNSTSGYLIDLNRLKMPVDNRGVIADVINTAFEEGGRYDEKFVLFSGGFFLGGKDGNNWWANAVASASRINDYLPGVIGFPNDPRNILYTVKTTNPPFGNSWEEYKYAVQLGADFYDGNPDGIYDPIDLNGNGSWDYNEDGPNILGDENIWCVFNDGVPSYVRKFNDVDPKGILIQQMIFGVKQAPPHPTNSILFTRYRLINTGSVTSQLDSVYFGIWIDPDIGNENGAYVDDLAGCDTLRSIGYSYNSGDDLEWGINPPAIGTALLQGPVVYIPGETFIDLNTNGIYDEGIDTPIDTAYNMKGPLLGSLFYPGAKNLGLTSFLHFLQAHPTQGDPLDVSEAIWNLKGYNKIGHLIDPCTWTFGTVTGVLCNEVNPIFLYSGNPVTAIGWLNSFETDQRMMSNMGPFKLVENEPVDIWIAYVVGRGSNSLNSISVMKDNLVYALDAYASNFSNLPVGVIKNKIILNEFLLYQNYPNPFNPVTKIRFSIPGSAILSEAKNLTTLKVYDLLGQEITALVNEVKPAGTYEVEFDGSRLASGVYFYQLKAGNYVSTKKMILIK